MPTTEPTSPGEPELADEYDVVVIGGGFAGSAFATLLHRWQPQSRILVLERNERFFRKVGEATVEVSAFFLHRVLGLYGYLSRAQLPKHGLRYWFSDRADLPLHEMSEVGPFTVPTLATFQLDRPLIDQHLMDTAAKEGSTVLRPAKVVDVEIGWPQSTLRFEKDGTRHEVRCRWLIDASGRRGFLAKLLKVRQEVPEHPTAAIWARFHGVPDLDGPVIMGEDPRAPRMTPIHAARRLATNHFCDYGWWCWAIPMSSGQTSIGLVYNKELFTPPGDGSVDGTLRDRFLRFLQTHPGLRELVANAEIVKEKHGDEELEDLMALGHLPYKTSQYMGQGWALIGDAAGFLDPYYSPGLDHVSMSTFATARLVEKDLKGQLDQAALEAEIAEHNATFVRSFKRWLDALYVGKYELMGDAELLGAAFIFDTTLYYLGVVTAIYKDVEAIGNPVFGPPTRRATFAYRFMRAFHNRLIGLARFRRKAGLYGRRNSGVRIYSKLFGLGPAAAVRPLAQALRIWLRLEVERVLYSLRPGRSKVSTAQPVAAAPASAQQPSTATQ